MSPLLFLLSKSEWHQHGYGNESNYACYIILSQREKGRWKKKERVLRWTTSQSPLFSLSSSHHRIYFNLSLSVSVASCCGQHDGLNVSTFACRTFITYCCRQITWSLVNVFFTNYLHIVRDLPKSSASRFIELSPSLSLDYSTVLVNKDCHFLSLSRSLALLLILSPRQRKIVFSFSYLFYHPRK